jgi:hypothetical protein
MTSGSLSNTRRGRNRKVFLDIPYRGPYKRYELAIKSALLAHGLEPILARDRSVTKIILENVGQLIRSCKYGVVDISGLKFNVGFEAGYLTALPRKFVILKNKKTVVPADLEGLIYCEYSDKDDLIIGLVNWLNQNVPEARQIPEHKKIRDLIDGIKRSAKVGDDIAYEIIMTMTTTLANSGGKLTP